MVIFFALLRNAALLSTLYRLYKILPSTATTDKGRPRGRRRPSRRQWIRLLNQCLFLALLDNTLALTDRLAQWLWIPFYWHLKTLIWLWIATTGGHGADVLWQHSGLKVLKRYHTVFAALEDILEKVRDVTWRPLSDVAARTNIDGFSARLSGWTAGFGWFSSQSQAPLRVKRTGLTPPKRPVVILKRPERSHRVWTELQTPMAPGAFALPASVPAPSARQDALAIETPQILTGTPGFIPFVPLGQASSAIDQRPDGSPSERPISRLSMQHSPVPVRGIKRPARLGAGSPRKRVQKIEKEADPVTEAIKPAQGRRTPKRDASTTTRRPGLGAPRRLQRPDTSELPIPSGRDAATRMPTLRTRSKSAIATRVNESSLRHL